FDLRANATFFRRMTLLPLLKSDRKSLGERYLAPDTLPVFAVNILTLLHRGSLLGQSTGWS
ncbi:hypothetical protein P3375_25900, partial [Vibrio parahaemolyticus]|nr:hypothetical protein [Vibrio parahaemolyticus]